MHWRWRSPLPRPASATTTPPTTSRWFAVGNAARNGLTAALAAQQGFTSDLKLARRQFPFGHLRRDARYRRADRRARRAQRLDRGLVQAVVRGAPDHGGDAGAQGDHRERRRARGHEQDRGFRAAAASQDDRPRRHRRGPRIPSHQPALSAWRSRPWRRTWHSTCGQSPPELPPAVRAFMDKIKVDAGRGPARGLSAHLAGAGGVTTGSTRHERLVTHVPGDPARPFDRARVREKFLRFVGPMIGKSKAEQILARCSDVCCAGSVRRW